MERANSEVFLRARLLCSVLTLLVSSSLFAAPVELRPVRIQSCDGCYPHYADFNGDGLDDALIDNRLQFNLGGRFGAPIVVPVGVTGARLADFNRDGFADMITNYDERGDGPEHLLVGNGAGGFTEVDFQREGGRVMQAADVTGDGIIDLLQLHVTAVAQHVTILRGNGDATFTQHQTFPWPYQINHDGEPIGVGDLNGDGRPDLVFNHDRYLDFVFAQADGTFGPPVSRYTMIGVRPVSVIDMNGDGNNDLVFMDVHYNGGVSVMYGDGKGRFPAHTRIDVPDTQLANRSPQNMAIGDFAPGGGKEIALALASAEIIMFSASDGQLREVGRTPISGQVHRVYPGRFRSTQPELLVAGLDREHTRTPWLGAAWFVETTGSAAEAAAPRVRGRASGRSAAFVGGGTYDLVVQSKRCGIESLKTWTIEREGLFVNFAPMPNVTRVESAHIDGVMNVRLFLNEGGTERVLEGDFKSSPQGLSGALTEWGGGPDAPCPGVVIHKIEAHLIK
jgi:hypothetical protein